MPVASAGMNSSFLTRLAGMAGIESEGANLVYSTDLPAGLLASGDLSGPPISSLICFSSCINRWRRLDSFLNTDMFLLYCRNG